ncbi:DUF1574 domain-containing protein [Clostridium estertheticum]|uniref:DUF1574 domain-containing protein n=1 Tax=Clostridium estertheticum TaxID=238834 RepID=UPI001C0CC0B8|nr:DUF1574 domain-containing protein [Clostridium estertheticum]MBU3178145.1 DUF1574 domain-containing protein [Clostridium estertheticum]
MKKFIIKCLVFGLSIALFLNIYTKYSTKVMINTIGPSTGQQIDFSFENVVDRDYNLLILGNSRIYRGVNPDKLDYSAYNFANDEDSFNQCYYKLKYLESNNKHYKYIILGVDYFEFSFLEDERNKFYGKYLGQNYLKDYNSKQNVLEYLNDDKINGILNSKFTQTIRPVIKQLSGQKNIIAPNKLKENGQYIVQGEAKTSDKVTRYSVMLPKQKMYYDKILLYAKEKSIPIFLVMPPARENELKNYSSDTIEKYNKMFNQAHLDNKNAYFLNYTNDKNFELKDFIDISHLNKDAADRFTIELNNDIKKRLNSK